MEKKKENYKEDQASIGTCYLAPIHSLKSSIETQLVVTSCNLQADWWKSLFSELGTEWRH